MKKLVIILFIFLGNQGYNQTTAEQARDIFKERFISLSEAKEVYPELPNNLPILFSVTELENNYSFWLLPLYIKGVPQYVLLNNTFFLKSPEMFQNISGCDTLNLSETRKALILLSRKRPQFPSYRGISECQYIFLTKDSDPIKPSLKKSLFFINGRYISLNLPEADFGHLEKNYISFSIKNLLFFEIISPPIQANKNETAIFTCLVVKRAR